MPRIPNSNTLVGTILDGLQVGASGGADGQMSASKADALLGGLLLEHLERKIDEEWNSGSFLRVSNDASYENIIRSLRGDMYVETVIGNFPAREKQGHACIMDQTGKAIAVIQTLYDWQKEEVVAILDDLERLQYVSGLALAVLAIALPFRSSGVDEQHEHIRQEIDKGFGPYSGRLSRYVNPVITFTGRHLVAGDTAVHWATGEHLSGYTSCCVYYPFGESGVMSPFDNLPSAVTAIQ